MITITNEYVIIASRIMADCVVDLLRAPHSEWSRLINELDMAHDDWQNLYFHNGEEFCLSMLYNGDKVKELYEAFYC